MNKKFLKIWYIFAGIFAGLAIVYYIVRLIDLTNPHQTSDILIKMNISAIIFLGIAFIMLLGAIPLSNYLDKRVDVKVTKTTHDQELLTKYKSKKQK